MHTDLILQDRFLNGNELIGRFIDLIKSRFPVQFVELLMSTTQRLGDLIKVNHGDSKEESSLYDMDSNVQQLVDLNITLFVNK